MKSFVLINSFARTAKQYGLKAALRTTFGYLGIGEIRIKYPLLESTFTVHGNPVFWNLLQNGRWELSSIKYVLSVLGEGQTILDVGAWIGSYTLLFARSVQAT